MELILIRHALPLRTQSTDGQPADPALSDEGHEQAAALSRWLTKERVDRLYSSPLRRALETAAALSEVKQLEIEVEVRIAEFDRDADLYVPLEELKRTDYDAWKAFVQGGYEDGRDLDAFRRDVVAGLEEIIADNPGGRVAVVCHGGVINAWAVHLLGIQRPLFFGPDYTSMNRFMAARSGERSLESLNEVPHLRDLRRSARLARKNPRG